MEKPQEDLKIRAQNALAAFINTLESVESENSVDLNKSSFNIPGATEAKYYLNSVLENLKRNINFLDSENRKIADAYILRAEIYLAEHKS